MPPVSQRQPAGDGGFPAYEEPEPLQPPTLHQQQSETDVAVQQKLCSYLERRVQVKVCTYLPSTRFSFSFPTLVNLAAAALPRLQNELIARLLTIAIVLSILAGSTLLAVMFTTGYLMIIV